jgi:DNA-binding NarL/FixJ family response regulator
VSEEDVPRLDVAADDIGTPVGEPLPELTQREREVATMLARGEPNREIATALGISIKTVDTHRAHVLKKLGLRNNVELARLVIRRGHMAA